MTSQVQVGERDHSLKEKDLLCQQLRDRLNTTPPSIEVGVQTTNNSPSTDHVMSHPPISLVDSNAPLDASLNCEMELAGVEVPDPFDSSGEASLSNISIDSIDNTVGVAMPIPEQVSLAEVVKSEEKIDGDEPLLFIAKFSYNPAEQSPNTCYNSELTLCAGDFLYVYGGVDVDGFYQSRLATGETGLVPSNFVEPVEDGDGV